MKFLVKIIVFPIELALLICVVLPLMCLSAVVDFFKWLFTNEPDEEEEEEIDPNKSPLADCWCTDCIPVKKPKEESTEGK